MAVLIEGKNSFFLSDSAQVLGGKHEVAWAEKYVSTDPAKGWVLGKYVEADKANHNRQYWALDALRVAQPSISHAPMNMLHRPRNIVGAFVATELVYPVAGEEVNEAAYEYANPYIEALGVFWKYYFPEEYAVVEAAHASGSLFFSMECVANTITCGGDDGCGTEFAYAGPRSETYCAHLNEGASWKQLNDPHFLAGALIIPPERPGWSGAEIKDLSALTKDYQEESELAYAGLVAENKHLTDAQWEYVMSSIVQHAKGL